MTNIRLSRAGFALSISRPLKTNSYKDEKRELGGGSSNLKNLRIGEMGRLKCYGAQEVVRLSPVSLDHTCSLAAVRTAGAGKTILA